MQNNNTNCRHCSYRPPAALCPCGFCGFRKPCCQRSAGISGGIHAQLIHSAHVLLGHNGNIIFDTIRNHSTDHISLDRNTGQFLLAPARHYYISCWVTVDGTELTPIVEFALAIGQTHTPIASSPQCSCQVSGTALIASGRTTQTLTLKNVSGNAIRFADTAAQANIVITEIRL